MNTQLYRDILFYGALLHLSGAALSVMAGHALAVGFYTGSAIALALLHRRLAKNAPQKRQE